MFVDYYEILEISVGATENEIKIAFRKQATKWHPDRNNGKDSTIRMQLINEAYLILKDKEAREKYDSEYKKFKNYSDNNRTTVNEEQDFTYSGYDIQDDILYKWMQNARSQAVNLAKQTVKDFKEIGTAGGKAAGKEFGKQFIAQVLISIIAIIIFSIIGLCSSNHIL